ncbi:MAG: hypothetical protein M1824_002818 [Vezdaea acicularis]|nr:MAG: hypothetical protein M1824_002818 [Vezdaea acicularis]
MGVLVGTSLIVIIPEGIETLYSASTPSQAHAHTKRTTYSQDSDVRWPSIEARSAYPKSFVPDLHNGNIKSILRREAAVIGAFPHPSEHDPQDLVDSRPTHKGDNPPPDVHTQKEVSDSLESHEVEAESTSPHAWVGLSLILGFILMFLIDELPRHASSSQSPPEPYHISLDNLSQGLHRTSSPAHDPEAEGFLQPRSSSGPSSRSTATTTGLVIHAAADGIALGASSSTDNTSLGFIIFIAIMVHKAPAAFGLTSVLLKQGLTKREARAHLIIFSLAAPVGALVTWFLAHLLGGGGSGSGERTQWWTGVLLLFSAGTFLYVAMHAMQESSPSYKTEALNGYAEGGPRQQEEPRRMRDTLAAVAGMLLPLLTQVGHHHH